MKLDLQCWKSNSTGKTNTMGSNEKFLRMKFIDELVGADTSVADGYANETVPDIRPLSDVGSALENCNEYGLLLS